MKKVIEMAWSNSGSRIVSENGKFYILRVKEQGQNVFSLYSGREWLGTFDHLAEAAAKADEINNA